VSLDDLHAVLDAVARSRSAKRRQPRLRMATRPRRAPKTMSGGGGFDRRERRRIQDDSPALCVPIATQHHTS
jgi:hypothetical protein